MRLLHVHDTSALLILTTAVLVLTIIMAGSTENAEAFSNPSPSEAANDLPRLPPPDPDSNLRSIRLGETIRFEEYGPIILNKDGSTRRISNWDILTGACVRA